MGVFALLAVDHFHQKRPLDVELRDLVQSRGWQDDLGAEVELRSLGAGSHDEGVASVVLVESLHDGPAAVAGHVVEVVWVTGVEATPCAWTVLVRMCQSI